MTELDAVTTRLTAMEARVAELERQVTLNSKGEKLLTTKELAALIGYAPGTLENWRTAGTGGPPYCKHGKNGAVRCKPSLVNKWLKKQQRTPIEFK